MKEISYKDLQMFLKGKVRKNKKGKCLWGVLTIALTVKTIRIGLQPCCRYWYIGEKTMKRTLLDILVDAGEAYLSMVGSNYSSYPYSYEEHKHEYDDNTPSSVNKSAS